MMHDVQMPSDMARVQVTRVLPKCKDLDPPEQPEEAEGHMKLIDCKN